MKKICKIVQLPLAFVGGLVSGLLLVHGLETWAQRDGLPGGEVLILPLIFLLIYLGWQMSEMWREFW